MQSMSLYCRDPGNSWVDRNRAGTSVGSGKILVITFQAKILGKQNFPYQVGYDWSIKAGDEAVIFVMDLFMLEGGTSHRLCTVH